MKGKYLGEFEELVLLTVAAIQQEGAYGNSILEEIELKANRKVNLSAVHSAMHRLEKKGFLESYKGEATAIRGGKRKRLYKITSYGIKALHEIKGLRNSMWKSIPQIIIEKGNI